MLVHSYVFFILEAPRTIVNIVTGGETCRVKHIQSLKTYEIAVVFPDGGTARMLSNKKDFCLNSKVF